MGAKDGQLLSGRAIDNDDPLSRRDQGLEFLDVTGQVRVETVNTAQARLPADDIYRFTNTSDTVVDTHLLIVVRGLPPGTRLTNASGVTHDGDPYIRVFLPSGVLAPGQHIIRRLAFSGPTRKGQRRYRLTLLSGQGAP